MYKLYIGVLILLAGGVAVAAEQPTEASSEKISSDSQQVAPEKDSHPQPAPPAATFTPSEKVSADSAVSFPVDI